MRSKAQAAAAQVKAAAGAITEVTAPTLPGPPAELPPVVFDRLSVERRVLAFITDGFTVPLGPRNTLAALTYDLMRDPHTTHPPEPNGRLEVDGRTVEMIAQTVLDHLTALIDAGLVEQRDDGSYAVTDAGRDELNS